MKLDYTAIRENLKSVIKDNPKLKDINFEASGVSAILDILAKSQHNFGAYAYMLHNESSIDTATLESTIRSKSRGLGYMPRGKRAARVEAVISQTLPTFPKNGYIVLHKNKKISAYTQRDISVLKTFTNVDDVYIYDYVENTDGTFTFTSDPVTLFEGAQDEWRFVVDRSVLYQKFVIRDEDLDIDTLRVFVKNTENDDGEAYVLAGSIFEVTEKSKVFYVTTSFDGYYEIYFGNGVYGVQPTDGQIIHCEYVKSSGEDGNGFSKFTLDGFTITPSEMSNTGSEAESLDNMRFNAMNEFKSQNRISQLDDYRSAVLKSMRNISTVNVWGGENNIPKRYGKVMLSIKPEYTDKLSESAKRELRIKILGRKDELGADVVFVDPEFIECDVTAFVKADLSLSNVTLSDIENLAVGAMTEYNDKTLNVFENNLIDVDLNSLIKSRAKSIKSSYTKKRLRKRVSINYANTSENFINFSNPIDKGSVKAVFKIGRYEFDIYDEDGVLKAHDVLEHDTLLTVGTVDYKTGFIKMKMPVKGYSGESVVEFSVIPTNPDIYSALNNIVRISVMEVVHV